MAATFTYPGFGPRPPFNPGAPAQLANGSTLETNPAVTNFYSGPGATMPAGSYGQRRGRPAWSQNNNAESTVQPAAVSQADLLAEEEAAAAVTPATPAPAASTSWLDENTITASYTNGQVLLAGGALLAVIYLFKRR